MFFSLQGCREELRVRVVLEEGQGAPAVLGRGRQGPRAAQQQRGQEDRHIQGRVAIKVAFPCQSVFCNFTDTAKKVYPRLCELIHVVIGGKLDNSRNLKPIFLAIFVHGDHSACSKPPVDIDLKVAF